MTQLIFGVLAYVHGFLRSRHDLGLEILALRQQLTVLKRRHPRPHLKRLDRLFWVALSSLWGGWSDALIVVKPDTVARRECFDHVIAINEAHVRRLGREFVAYYHDDRTHLGLKKDTPAGRPVESKPDGGRLESQSRLGGLHHRYVWNTAA